MSIKTSRVLLVENDFLIAMTVADQLVELGYAVVGPAYSLTDARELASGTHFDAALVDWNLDATRTANGLPDWSMVIGPGKDGFSSRKTGSLVGGQFGEA